MKELPHHIKQQRRLKKARRLMKRIDACKDLYQQLDALTLELRQDGFEEGIVDGELVRLVDNFAGRNVAWRAHAARRFELVVGTGKRKGKK